MSILQSVTDTEAERTGLSQLTPWPEPVTDAPALFDEVHARSLLYLHLPPGAAVVLALWPTHAHAIRAFTQTPRLNLTSTEPGAGKSTALSFLAALCPKVLRTDNLKTAVLFRIVERHQPTLLLDELDTYIHLYPELRGLLNAGHDPDACVHRIENHQVRSFRSFAPVALAGLGHLAPTLRDRSIVISLSKAPPGSIRARLDKRKLEAEHILGQKMARWTRDNFEAIAACDPPIPACNRLADNWRPLFSIAHVIGGHWPERILESFNLLTNTPSAASDSNTRALLGEIRSIFAQAKQPSLSSKQLVAALLALPERPWSSNGSAINETWLATQLRPFEIRPHNIRFSGHRAKGYALSDFNGAFSHVLNE